MTLFLWLPLVCVQLLNSATTSTYFFLAFQLNRFSAWAYLFHQFHTRIFPQQLDLLYQRMNSMIHRVKPERTDLDMIYEIMLKLGVPLTYSVTPFSINNKTVYGVGDDCLLLVCLAEDVQPEDVEQMTEYAPAKIIISRDSFADDTAMANAYYILRDHGIELKLV